jgi:hypothetical protein
VIFRVDKDGIVRTGSHTGFAADADGFVEIDDAVGTLEHRRGGARGRTRGVRALIATRHLVRAPHLGPLADVHVLDVSARDTDGDNILGLARGRTGMTTDAASVVDDFRPLHTICASCLLLDHVYEAANIPWKYAITGLKDKIVDARSGQPLYWFWFNVTRLRAWPLQFQFLPKASPDFSN